LRGSEKQRLASEKDIDSDKERYSGAGVADVDVKGNRLVAVFCGDKASSHLIPLSVVQEQLQRGSQLASAEFPGGEDPGHEGNGESCCLDNELSQVYSV